MKGGDSNVWNADDGIICARSQGSDLEWEMSLLLLYPFRPG